MISLRRTKEAGKQRHCKRNAHARAIPARRAPSKQQKDQNSALACTRMHAIPVPGASLLSSNQASLQHLLGHVRAITVRRTSKWQKGKLSALVLTGACDTSTSCERKKAKLSVRAHTCMRYQFVARALDPEACSLATSSLARGRPHWPRAFEVIHLGHCQAVQRFLEEGGNKILKEIYNLHGAPETNWDNITKPTEE